MKEYKAKKVYTYYGKYSNTVEYEYRGEKYDVEFSTNETYYCPPAWYQHKTEQEKIDKMLDMPPIDYSDLEPAQKALDDFFSFINGE